MDFTSKEITKAIRDFNNAASDLLNSTYDVIQVRIDHLAIMLRKNPAIHSVVNPLLELELDIEIIQEVLPTHWIRLNLPTYMNEQIAYILQLIENSHLHKLYLLKLLVD